LRNFPCRGTESAYARRPLSVHFALWEGSTMNNLKLRVLPYAGVLTVIASLAGYYGGR
jgi:hypothetical protein